MKQFWTSLKEATSALGGSHYTENDPLVGGGQKRWPSIIRTATIHNTPYGGIKMRHVDCYGWRVLEK